jgi:hypothetical protein
VVSGQTQQAVAAITFDYRARDLNRVGIDDTNHGKGSSREHAPQDATLSRSRSRVRIPHGSPQKPSQYRPSRAVSHWPEQTPGTSSGTSSNCDESSGTRRAQMARCSGQARACHQLSVAIVRLGHSRYRAMYERKKAAYLARPQLGPSACPFAQPHLLPKVPCAALRTWPRRRRSARYAVKQLMRGMWVAWRAAHAGPAGRTLAELASRTRNRLFHRSGGHQIKRVYSREP